MGYQVQIEISTQQCDRCDTPLLRRDTTGQAEASTCRPCLRVLDADVFTKKRILFPLADFAGEGELLSAFA